MTYRLVKVDTCTLHVIVCQGCLITGVGVIQSYSCMLASSPGPIVHVQLLHSHTCKPIPASVDSMIEVLASNNYLNTSPSHKINKVKMP